MSINAETLRRLSALQLAPEAMQEVLSIIASCIEPQETRRRRDRDRKRDKPQNIRGTGSGISAETVTEIPPVHITTPPRQKSKRISVCIDASEIPANPSEEASGYSKAKGWDQSKTEGEWQRFRDHSLSKGRKHRDLLAAWRNWVTSPFQSTTVTGGPKAHVAENRSLVAAARRAADRLAGESDLGDGPSEPVLRLVSES